MFQTITNIIEKVRESETMLIPCLRPSHCPSPEDKQCRGPRYSIYIIKISIYEIKGRQALLYRAGDLNLRSSKHRR